MSWLTSLSWHLGGANPLPRPRAGDGRLGLEGQSSGLPLARCPEPAWLSSVGAPILLSACFPQSLWRRWPLLGLRQRPRGARAPDTPQPVVASGPARS